MAKNNDNDSSGNKVRIQRSDKEQPKSIGDSARGERSKSEKTTTSTGPKSPAHGKNDSE